MASKDNVNKNVWKAEERPAYNFDKLYSESEIRNSLSETEHSRLEPIRDPYQRLSDNVWEELRASQDTDTRLSTDVGLLRKETADLRGKNSSMYKAVVELKSDNERLRGDLKILQDIVLNNKPIPGQSDGSRRSDSPAIHDLQEMKRQAAIFKGMQQDLNDFRTEGIALRAELNDTKSELNALKSQNHAIKSKLTELLDKDTDVEQLKLTVEDLHKKIADLNLRNKDKTCHEGFYCNGCKTKPIVGIRYKCLACSDYDQCETCFNNKVHPDHKMMVFTERETRDQMLRVKVCRQIAFTADLKESASFSSGGKLVCSCDLVSIGGGYNFSTGEFEAPIAGTYCFLLTVAPKTLSSDDVSYAQIMKGNMVKGAVLAKGSAWSTGHTILCLKPGEKVWLNVPSNGQHSFCKDITTFTGFLIQADL